VSARLPPDPSAVLMSLSACPDPCYCGYRQTAAECAPKPPPDTLTGTSADIGSALAEVRGLDLGRTRLCGRKVNLPQVLLQVDGSVACRGVHRPVVAVTFGVLKDKIGITSRRAKPLTRILHLPAGTAAGILLFAKDDDLEDLWARRRAWAGRIAELHPAFVVAPDFSLWAGDHALATRYNLVRSVRFIELLQDRGLPVVPHFYWATPRDIRDIVTWIDENEPQTVAIDVQCMQRPTWAFLAELEWLRGQLRQPPDLLVAGLDIGRGLHAIAAVWPNIAMTRNFVPEVAKHVDVRDTPDDWTVRVSSDDSPAVLLERRILRAENWFRARESSLTSADTTRLATLGD
jgi:hypothetical protein